MSAVINAFLVGLFITKRNRLSIDQRIEYKKEMQSLHFLNLFFSQFNWGIKIILYQTASISIAEE